MWNSGIYYTFGSNSCGARCYYSNSSLGIFNFIWPSLVRKYWNILNNVVDKRIALIPHFLKIFPCLRHNPIVSSSSLRWSSCACSFPASNSYGLWLDNVERSRRQHFIGRRRVWHPAYPESSSQAPPKAFEDDPDRLSESSTPSFTSVECFREF